MNIYLLLVMLVVAIMMFLYLMPSRMELFSLGSTSSMNRSGLSDQNGRRNILRKVTASMVKKGPIYTVNLGKAANYRNLSDLTLSVPVTDVVLKWNGFPLYRSKGDLPVDWIPVEYMAPYPVTLEVTSSEDVDVTFTLYERELPASSRHRLVSKHFTLDGNGYQITDGIVTQMVM